MSCGSRCDNCIFIKIKFGITKIAIEVWQLYVSYSQKTFHKLYYIKSGIYALLMFFLLLLLYNFKYLYMQFFTLMVTYDSLCYFFYCLITLAH